MVSNISAVIIALILLGLSERMKNETKEKYRDKGYDWSYVLFYSNLAAIILGFTSIFFIEISSAESNYNSSFIVFGVVILSYAITQSFMTDIRILLINRKMLRVAYLSMYLISLYNVIFIPEYRENWIPLVGFTIMLVLLFLFSSMGASDVRAIAIGLPFAVSISGYESINIFILSLLVLAFAMIIRNHYRDREAMRKFKLDNIEHYKKMNKLLFYKLAKSMVTKNLPPEKLAMPVGPYMMIPFFVYLLTFPFSPTI